MSTLITPAVAAEIIGCSPRQVRNAFEKGRIAGEKYSDRVILLEKKSCVKYGKNRPKPGRKKNKS